MKLTCAVVGCNDQHHAFGYCGRHAARLKRHGDPLGGQMFRGGGTVADRLAHYSEVRDNGCVHWMGSLQTNGYGYLSVDGERRMAHILAYEHHAGPIPDGLELDHLCHNKDSECPCGWACMHRRCVNVEHLEPVTRSENMMRANARVPKTDTCSVSGCENRPHARGWCITPYARWRRNLARRTGQDEAMV